MMYSTKHKIFEISKDAGEPLSYGVSEDYSLSVRDVRKKLLFFMQEKHTEFPEKKVFMKYDTVVVDKNISNGIQEKNNVQARVKTQILGLIHVMNL